jgi:hypothetical protein
VRSSAEQLALVRGWDDTRATLRRWQRRPAAAVAPWALASLAVAVALLAATWVVAILAVPDPGFFALRNADPWGDYAFILYRNGLVLALHAMACVAGFMAGSSLPLVAEGHSGWWRSVHDRAGKLAMAFVGAATLFSLVTQAFVLGSDAATLGRQLGIGHAMLIVTLLPHALPELVALFLPLAAWLVASRSGRWNELLAATVATTALALPVLLVTALVEVYVWPDLLRAASPLP